MAKRKPTDIVNLKVRLTEQLRARLEQDAKKNNRSLNKEIVHRLGLTYGEQGAAMANQFDEIEKQMWEQLQGMVRKITAERKQR